MPRPRGVVPSALALSIAISVVSASRPARADDKEQCVAASEKAQELRNAGKLTQAREQLTVCGRAVCPKLIEKDCTQWMTEVLGILPSVVPGAKDKSGRDLIDVKVSVDGQVVTSRLDGKAIDVDPGVHTFRFEAKDAEPVEERVVIRQGEKNRILTVSFGGGSDASAKPPERPSEPKEGSSPPIAAYIVGGLGLATLGAALYIDLDANGDARKLRDTCAPKCAQADVDDVDQRYTIAGVTAGIGGALLITGVVLFFVHGSGESKSSALPVVRPSRGGLGTVFTF